MGFHLNTYKLKPMDLRQFFSAILSLIHVGSKVVVKKLVNEFEETLIDCYERLQLLQIADLGHFGVMIEKPRPLYYHVCHSYSQMSRLRKERCA